MSRIASRFASLQHAGRKALVPYITAGDPHPTRTVRLMHALVEGGADLIELGMPFSDPMADGPVIQLACERALAAGTTLRGVLAMVAEFRQRDFSTPVVLMGYLNPVEAMGIASFAEAAVAAGVDAVLLVDLAIEEAPEVLPVLRNAGLDTVFLLAPTSSDERIAAVAGLASGYLYYVSLKGVTGAASLDVASVTDNLRRIRRETGLPVAVGFGIRDAESAARVARVADAVVVGSALVAEIARLADQPEVLETRIKDQLLSMRTAMDQPLTRQDT